MTRSTTTKWCFLCSLALAACGTRDLINADASDGSTPVDTASDAPADVTATDAMDVAQLDAVDAVDAPGQELGAPDGSDAVDATDATDVTNLADATDATDVTNPTDATDAGPACSLAHVVVATSDYMSIGAFVRVDLATHTFQNIPASADAGIVEQDHLVRRAACTLIDIERGGTNAIVPLDSTTLAPSIHPIPLPMASNHADAAASSADPADLAMITPHKAYVLQYNADRIAIIDPATGTLTSATVDVSALDDSDGIPEMSNITVVGSRAYVSLQQLNRNAGYSAPTHSHIAVIDTTTDALIDVDPTTAGVQGIQLTNGNPGSVMPVSADGRYLLVAEPGNLFVPGSPGSIDVIDLTTNTVVRNITNAALGGNPTSVEIVSGNTAWTTLDRSAGVDAGSVHVIVAFDWTTGTVTAAPIALSTLYTYAGLRRAPDGSVWAIGSDYNMGSIHAFDHTTGAPLFAAHTTGALNTVAFDFAP